jgi:hypothetical protein
MKSRKQKSCLLCLSLAENNGVLSDVIAYFEPDWK